MERVAEFEKLQSENSFDVDKVMKGFALDEVLEDSCGSQVVNSSDHGVLQGMDVFSSASRHVVPFVFREALGVHPIIAGDTLSKGVLHPFTKSVDGTILSIGDCRHQFFC